MTHTEDIGNYYLISHLALFTGLTDRTIRTYIANGILQGEKINGLWHFTAEQVDAFLRHPMVKPSIQAKKNAIVYDFMLDNHKTGPQTCMILDLPGCDEKKTAEYFCYAISNGSYWGIRFSFDSANGTPRVILRGKITDVMELVQNYNK